VEAVKKMLVILTVLAAGVWAMSFKSGYCELEGEKTHKAALPVLEALAAYAEKNGIPNLDSFEQIEGIPYELKPCSERPELMECEVLDDGYYFQIGEDYYAVGMAGSPTNNKPKGFFLSVAHNYTICDTLIFYDGHLVDTYSKLTCSLNGKCAGWFRQ